MSEYDEAVVQARRTWEFYRSPEGIRVQMRMSEQNQERRMWGISLLHNLSVADCFYWAPPICRLTYDAASTMPLDWQLEETMVPTPRGFFWLADKFTIPESIRQGVRPGEWNPAQANVLKHICAFSWTPIKHREGPPSIGVDADLGVNGDGVLLGAYEYVRDVLAPKGVLVPINITWLDWGDKVEDVWMEEGEKDLPQLALRLFLAQLLFLQQRILTYSPQPLSRSTRRGSPHLADRTVNVIALRQRVHADLSKQAERDAVEWQCQWMVRGHWRQHWYPASKQHRPKWIAPHVKGPEGKPLRHTEKVFAVIR